MEEIIWGMQERLFGWRRIRWYAHFVPFFCVFVLIFLILETYPYPSKAAEDHISLLSLFRHLNARRRFWRMVSFPFFKFTQSFLTLENRVDLCTTSFSTSAIYDCPLNTYLADTATSNRRFTPLTYSRCSPSLLSPSFIYRFPRQICLYCAAGVHPLRNIKSNDESRPRRRRWELGTGT